MTLDDIKTQFKAGTLNAEDALKQLGPFMKGPQAKRANALVSEILGISEEPKSMSKDEQEVAEGWERNYRK